ncbi:MAG: hypothetical protein AB1716_09260 [Planctomycetota bacterium]
MRAAIGAPVFASVATPALLLALVAGCRSTPDYRVLMRSANPLDRVQGIQAAYAERDLPGVAQLVGLLDDEDAAVRMFAIMALQRLTGETFGYQYYAPPNSRSAAVERWRQALRAGDVRVRATAAPRPASNGRPTTHAAGP